MFKRTLEFLGIYEQMRAEAMEGTCKEFSLGAFRVNDFLGITTETGRQFIIYSREDGTLIITHENPDRKDEIQGTDLNFNNHDTIIKVGENFTYHDGLSTGIVTSMKLSKRAETKK